MSSVYDALRAVVCAHFNTHRHELEMPEMQMANVTSVTVSDCDTSEHAGVIHLVADVLTTSGDAQYVATMTSDQLDEFVRHYMAEKKERSRCEPSPN